MRKAHKLRLISSRVCQMHMSIPSATGSDSFALRSILTKCIQAVDPGHLVQSAIHQNHDDPDTLKIRNLSLVLKKNCFVIGFGKATYKMAVELEKILGSHHVREGIISIPEGSSMVQPSSPYQLLSNSRLRVFEGAKNNLPDENAYVAAKNIKSLAEHCSKDDILFVLISGGGSALLPYPVPPVTLAEKCETIKLLSSAGADIAQINTVRKALSKLKGGKLAALAYPATTVALILSDVIDDPLHVIAAAPTVLSCENERENAADTLNQLRLYSSVPANVRKVLCENDDDDVSSRCETDDPSSWLHNIVVGNNATALAAAEIEAERLGYVPIVISSRIAGLVSDVATMYSELVVCMCTIMARSNSPEENLVQLRTSCKAVNGIEDVVERVSQGVHVIERCRREGKKLLLIGGGEPTVKVSGDGRGGRNQELALEVAVRLHDLKSKEERLMSHFDVVFASAGTDGIDGPTDAAGALSYPNLVKDALADNCSLDAGTYLQNNDSYSFFSKFLNGSCHIKTGHTGTNVMDVHFMLIGTKLEM